MKKVKKLVIGMAVCLSAACVRAWNPTPDQWLHAPMGICITNVVYHSSGVEVDFATDLPPPYRVGVHHPLEIGFARCRACPIAYVDTNDRHAFVPCKLYDVAVFVQVYKADDKAIVPSFWKVMSESEWSNWVQRIKRTPMRTVLDPSTYDLAKDKDLSGLDPYGLRLIADNTWCGFVYTNGTSFSGAIQMINRQTPGSETFETNMTEVAFSVKGRDPSVGKGFRIMIFDDSGAEPSNVIQVAAAYSAITNMSQEILIKRGWKSLSSNGEWKISTDWEGAPIMIPCTNAVPYRIYGEGL